MRRSSLDLLLVVPLWLAGCASPESGGTDREAFGQLPDGRTAHIYTLRNRNGLEARISNYGGTVVSLKVRDRNNQLGDIVLGHDNIKGYLTASPYFGSLIGRYANRIAQGEFTLNGKMYHLARNNGSNHLHGGVRGFDKVLWEAKPFRSKEGPALALRYVSKDGEEGYPGTLTVDAAYTLTDEDELRVDLTATTDKDTICNLTHHSYFNLAGSGDVLNHRIQIEADKFTPMNANSVPTGELQSVEGTPLDFRRAQTIGSRIKQDHEQLRLGKGYDHNYVLNKPAGRLGLAAKVAEHKSGRVMEVFTTEPGLQLYTGNFLDGSIKGKNGWVYHMHHGLCLEPQHFPDSPNRPEFPSTVLKAGETYKNTMVFKFSVMK